MKKLSILLLAGLAACAQPSRVDYMVPKFSSAALPASDARYESVSLVSTVVDPKKFPHWLTTVDDKSLAQAINKTLDGRALLSPGTAPSKYKLTATMADFKRPITKIDQSTTFAVHYTLVEAASGKAVIDETITTTSNAPYVAGAAVDEQTRQASETAMQMNLAQFVAKLDAALAPKAYTPAPMTTPAKKAPAKIKPKSEAKPSADNSTGKVSGNAATNNTAKMPSGAEKPKSDKADDKTNPSLRPH